MSGWSWSLGQCNWNGYISPGFVHSFFLGAREGPALLPCSCFATDLNNEQKPLKGWDKVNCSSLKWVILLVNNIHDRDWADSRAKSAITKGDIHQEDMTILNAYAPRGGALHVWSDSDGLERGNTKT